jgi:hypothetical protein
MTKETKISWLAENLEDIKKISMSIVFIAGLSYAGVDWLSTKFITKLEASNYALKQNVNKLDTSLARTQLIVYQNELYNARKLGISEQDKDYYRSVDRKIFELKIKLKMIEAKIEHYSVPKYLKD